MRDEKSADEMKNKRQKVVKDKKRKLGPDTTMEDLLEGWTQCCYFMKNKLRLCNIERTPGSKFCGNHPQPGENVTSADGVESNERNVRIPCPLDPTHTIFKHMLQNHLKICNATKVEAEITSQPFYCLNCNSGTNTDPTGTEQLYAGDAVDPVALVTKINKCYETFVENEVFHPVLTESPDLDAVIRGALGGKDQTAFKRVKHIEQDILMVHQMIEHKLLDDNHEMESTVEGARLAVNDARSGNIKGYHTASSASGLSAAVGSNAGLVAAAAVPSETTEQKNHYSVDKATANVTKPTDSCTTYVELGAGKGLLGLAVNCANPQSTLVLVERSSNRNKVDRYLKSHNRSFHRVRMDIRHCLVPKLPGVIAVADAVGSAASATPSMRADNGIDDNAAAVSVVGTKTAGTTTVAGAYSSVGVTGAKNNVVVIAKHLCGCASDMAIRSMTHLDTFTATEETVTADRESESVAVGSVASFTSDKKKHKRGIAIATCCHHACNYADYTGVDYYHSQGFTAAEFDVLRIWSGWAPLLLSNSWKPKQQHQGGDEPSTTTTPSAYTASTVVSAAATTAVSEEKEELEQQQQQQEEHMTEEVKLAAQTVVRPAGITHAEMAIIGQRVKRILDVGRLHFIRNTLKMEAKLVQYCDFELSPECMMILATEKE